VADAKAEDEPTILDRWLQEQLQWQRTMLTYLDSLAKNDEFVVHLGNAMRGSLLAGKPYPTPTAPGAQSEESPADDRLDRILFALHQLQGQVQDLAMSLEEIRGARRTPAAPAPDTLAAPAPARPTHPAPAARRRTTPARHTSRTKARKGRP
jgi:hypothetical protein